MNRRDLFKLGGKIGLVALAAQIPWTWLERAGLVDDWVAEAAALPQNYAESAGTILGDTAGGLSSILSSVGSGTGAVWTLSDDATPATLRPAGIATNMFKAVCTDAGSSQPQCQFNWTIATPPSAFSSLSFPLYVDLVGMVAPNTAISASILFSENSGFTNFWTYNDSQVFNRHWVSFRVGRQHAIATGSPNPATNHIRLRVLIILPAGATGTVLVGPVFMNRRGKPVMSMSFDDGWDSVQTIYDYTQPRALPMSAAVNGSTIGTANKLTVNQLLTMQTNGWSIHDHTWDHIDGAARSSSDLRVSVERNMAWMRTNGLTSGIGSFVYPYGSVQQADGWANVIGDYYQHAWSAEGSFYGIDTLDGMPTPLRLERCALGATSATTIDRMTRAIAAGKSIHFMGHTDTLASQTDAINLMMRLRDANVIHVRNLTDAIAGYTNPRQRRAA